MAINSVLILSTDTEALNVPSGKKYAITTLLVCNYATSSNSLNDTTFNMHVLKGSGDVKSNKNKVLNTVSMPAQETFTWNVERLILEEGDRVILNSTDSDKLSATISF